jgi:hypothetical protein
MKFSNDDLGMDEHAAKEVTPEDLESLPCYIRFKRGGMWFTINQTREVIANIMNGVGGYMLEDMKVVEYSPFMHTGEECNIMYIYDVQAKEWRLE